MSEGSRAVGILMIVVGGMLTLFGGGLALGFIWLAITFGLEQGLGAVLEILVKTSIPLGIGLLIAWLGVALIRDEIHRLKG